MSWNYRVVKNQETWPDGRVVDYYAIHEVYYDKDGKIHAYAEKSEFGGFEEYTDLPGTLAHMVEALARPLLTIEELNEAVASPEKLPDSDGYVLDPTAKDIDE